MKIPEPRIGMVIRHSFLFSNGDEKERPAVIIVAITMSDNDSRVAVMPITHSQPTISDRTVEIPIRVKRHLGLDDQDSWIVVDEINEFLWPGFDLRKVPGTNKWDYGQLPPLLIKAIVDKVKKLEAGYRSHIQVRD